MKLNAGWIRNLLADTTRRIEKQKQWAKRPKGQKAKRPKGQKACLSQDEPCFIVQLHDTRFPSFGRFQGRLVKKKNGLAG